MVKHLFPDYCCPGLERYNCIFMGLQIFQGTKHSQAEETRDGETLERGSTDGIRSTEGRGEKPLSASPRLTPARSELPRDARWCSEVSRLRAGKVLLWDAGKSQAGWGISALRSHEIGSLLVPKGKNKGAGKLLHATPTLPCVSVPDLLPLHCHPSLLPSNPASKASGCFSPPPHPPDPDARKQTRNQRWDQPRAQFLLSSSFNERFSSTDGWFFFHFGEPRRSW